MGVCARVRHLFVFSCGVREVIRIYVFMFVTSRHILSHQGRDSSHLTSSRFVVMMSYVMMS